jgi:hypothetical protein
MSSEDAERFRARARECRTIAAAAKSAEWQASLLALAQELEDEAEKIDLQEEPTPSVAPADQDLHRRA